MREIVVLGCGFAGYHAARQLEEGLAGRRRVRLTVVTRRAHFVFSPLLTSVCSGELEPDHLITPVDEAFDARTEVVVDHVERVDLESRNLYTEHRVIPFDYLVIATGGVRDPGAFEGAENLLGPDTLTDAIAIRNILKEQTQSSTSRRYAVIGASTTGVEWACELITSLTLENKLSSESGPAVTIDLFEAGDRLLPDHSEMLSHLAMDYLLELGIEVHLNQRVLRATPTEVTLADQTTKSYDQVFHCGGRIGASLGLSKPAELDERRRLRPRSDLRLLKVSCVYVAGDAVSPVEGFPRTSNPQIAMQQGQRAAKNLLADMTGRATRPFRFEDRGDFVTFGRDNAALEVRGLILEGKAAWLAYRLYFTALMPRAIQKARLLMDLVSRRTTTTESAPMAALPEGEKENGDEDSSSSP